MTRAVRILTIAVLVGGVSTVAPPATASTSVDRDDRTVTVTRIAPSEGGVRPMTTCGAAQYVDAWMVYFDCEVDASTRFSARCSDGFEPEPAVAPPGSWRVVVDCYPAFFSSFWWDYA
ncbi:hypothetical protein [Kibdelosporangium phytohabitans]|uniref:Secreted protein n=1 Tax=Kibdelosporangium phytohabitans TaxID=860235 RepID=A0A0N9I1Y5_9PSEU|nr:hypothetical protein [Kibdelosporangium phytohabitans]ALG08196.1 hypothetical protein AOZ06_15920 [Kibdelosporangium phytohabitans]MBE1470801.1 hypothetical protein [Kibdelosporangium phytohabitans]